MLCLLLLFAFTVGVGVGEGGWCGIMAGKAEGQLRVHEGVRNAD